MGSGPRMPSRSDKSVNTTGVGPAHDDVRQRTRSRFRDLVVSNCLHRSSRFSVAPSRLRVGRGVASRRDGDFEQQPPTTEGVPDRLSLSMFASHRSSTLCLFTRIFRPSEGRPSCPLPDVSSCAHAGGLLMAEVRGILVAAIRMFLVERYGKSALEQATAK